eukprot:30821-Pelagococcus_subviridis.AAC.3
MSACGFNVCSVHATSSRDASTLARHSYGSSSCGRETSPALGIKLVVLPRLVEHPAEETRERLARHRAARLRRRRRHDLLVPRLLHRRDRVVRPHAVLDVVVVPRHRVRERALLRRGEAIPRFRDGEVCVRERARWRAAADVVPLLQRHDRRLDHDRDAVFPSRRVRHRRIRRQYLIRRSNGSELLFVAFRFSRDARRRRRLPPFQRPHARRRVVRPYASDRGVVVQIVRVPERRRARVRGVLVEHRRRGGFPAARHRRRHRALVRPREGVRRVRARVSDRVVELRGGGGGGGGGRASAAWAGERPARRTDARRRREEATGSVRARVGSRRRNRFVRGYRSVERGCDQMLKPDNPIRSISRRRTPVLREGKVLKERRSPRERGRMGTSVITTESGARDRSTERLASSRDTHRRDRAHDEIRRDVPQREEQLLVNPRERLLERVDVEALQLLLRVRVVRRRLALREMR